MKSRGKRAAGTKDNNLNLRYYEKGKKIVQRYQKELRVKRNDDVRNTLRNVSPRTFLKKKQTEYHHKKAAPWHCRYGAAFFLYPMPDARNGIAQPSTPTFFLIFTGILSFCCIF